MGRIMDDWFGFDPSPEPNLPPVTPVAMPETGDTMDTLRRMRKRKGRAQTILTGDLEPLDIGKRTLLG